MYHRYLQLFNMGHILVNKTYFCRSNRRENLTILIKINACFLAHNIEETSERTERHRQAGRIQAGTDIMSSNPYVNGGTLLFQLPPNTCHGEKCVRLNDEVGFEIISYFFYVSQNMFLLALLTEQNKYLSIT